jgi:hypothetical protein
VLDAIAFIERSTKHLSATRNNSETQQRLQLWASVVIALAIATGFFYASYNIDILFQLALLPVEYMADLVSSFSLSIIAPSKHPMQGPYTGN